MGSGPDEVLKWFDAVNWLQGEWVPEIVVALWDGEKRFLDLLKEIRESDTQHRWSTRTRPMTKQSLARTLDAMQRDELVLRREDNSSAPRAVYYQISPLLREFLEQRARPAAEWIHDHQDLIERIRERRFLQCSDRGDTDDP